MRCSCPVCDLESFMIHSERDNCCVCPQCLYRCYACQGMGAGLTREEARMLRQEREAEEESRGRTDR